ncbi:MAG: GH3 auxin-responsive promoter family protein [Bacteroidetes bacterium]|nr:GH3 auxin-responsive promoter family protein [Bacteroidota bacterium]
MEVLNSFITWIFKSRLGQIEKFKKEPHLAQQTTLFELLEAAKGTEVGEAYQFSKIKSYPEFASFVPVFDYESFTPYLEKNIKGRQHVFWPSTIQWFAKSSGTTAGRSKYVPVSEESLEECHYKGGKDMVSLYLRNFPDSKLFTGKSLSVGGTLEKDLLHPKGIARAGDVSALIMHNLPIWAQFVSTPSRETALMSDWEAKIERMAQATMDENVTSIAGVPTWTIVLLQRILELKKASHILEVWPNLEVFFHGAVAFGPYRNLFKQLIPSEKMRYMEIYNASEGFFGMQDQSNSDELLLLLDHGIFYEFMPTEDLEKENPRVLSLEGVEVGKNYALIISTNGGLWRYKIGDTIKFTSQQPYRFRISGRTKHFINAFGEEVIVENAEAAIAYVCEHMGATIINFTAAPIYFKDSQSKGAHEWVVEFKSPPVDLEDFAEKLDRHLREINSDYDAKRYKNLALQRLQLHAAPAGLFESWLAKKGKLGGQHKVPRLSNSREFMEEILAMIPNPKK